MKLIEKYKRNLPLWYRVGETLHIRGKHIKDSSIVSCPVAILEVENCPHKQCVHNSRDKCYRYSIRPFISGLGEDDSFHISSCDMRVSCTIHNDCYDEVVIQM